MGYIISKDRPTRFPPSGPRDERSHMMDLRELEEAILALQKLSEAGSAINNTQTVAVAAMEKRIAQLEAGNMRLQERIKVLENKRK